MRGFTWGLVMELLAGLDKDLLADLELVVGLGTEPVPGGILELEGADLSLGLGVAEWLLVLELELCVCLCGG